MQPALPYVREIGSGPEVVCIHCNASSSAQWRALADLISAKHRVLTPDLYGSGKSPDWHCDREIALLDEVKFVERFSGRLVTLLSSSATPTARRSRCWRRFENPAAFVRSSCMSRPCLLSSTLSTRRRMVWTGFVRRSQRRLPHSMRATKSPQRGTSLTSGRAMGLGMRRLLTASRYRWFGSQCSALGARFVHRIHAA